MQLLLEANTEAVTSMDKARCCIRNRCPNERPTPRLHILRHPRCRSTSTCAAFLSCSIAITPPPQNANSNILRRDASYIQKGELPLHYATAMSKPFDVIKLLFDANRKAAAVVAKARRKAHVPAPTR